MNFVGSTWFNQQSCTLYTSHTTTGPYRVSQGLLGDPFRIAGTLPTARDRLPNLHRLEGRPRLWCATLIQNGADGKMLVGKYPLTTAAGYCFIMVLLVLS